MVAIGSGAQWRDGVDLGSTGALRSAPLTATSCGPLSSAERPWETLAGLLNGQLDPARVDFGVAVGDEVVRLLEPLGSYPRNLFCIGKNYREHAAEFSASGYDVSSDSGSDVQPTHPVVFTKPASAVIGPGELIERHAGLTAELDYEAELGVVIGRGGRGITAAEAMDHVFGYTIVNDVTARDPATPTSSVVPRQGPRPVEPRGAERRHGRRAGAGVDDHRMSGERRAAPEGVGRRSDLRRADADRDDLRGDHPVAGRRDRHRHARRRRHRVFTAAIPAFR